MNRQTVVSVQLLSLLALLACLCSADVPVCNPPKDIGSGAHGSCMCQTDKGVIDLNPLANNNGKPRFNFTASDGYTYTYNPCVTYPDTHPCEKVYICQSIWDGSKHDVYVVGESSEQIHQDPSTKKYYVSYASTGGSRDGHVNLICDQSTEGMITSVTQDKQTTTTHYILQLNSCHACPGGCAGGVAPGPIGLTIIFLIPVVFIIYFVVGALVMKFHYQATGTDIIPNKTFWLAIPLLIKDGCVFTFSPCVKLITSRRNDYQKI